MKISPITEPGTNIGEGFDSNAVVVTWWKLSWVVCGGNDVADVVKITAPEITDFDDIVGRASTMFPGRPIVMNCRVFLDPKVDVQQTSKHTTGVCVNCGHERKLRPMLTGSFFGCLC